MVTLLPLTFKAVLTLAIGIVWQDKPCLVPHYGDLQGAPEGSQVSRTAPRESMQGARATLMAPLELQLVCVGQLGWH